MTSPHRLSSATAKTPPAERSCIRLLAAVLIGLVATPSHSQPHPPAGLLPFERPAGAPVKVEVEGMGEGGLKGVEGEVPGSVGAMVREQGEWYSPFSRAGMTGPYDLRGWHRPAAGDGRSGRQGPGGGNPGGARLGQPAGRVAH